MIEAAAEADGIPDSMERAKAVYEQYHKQYKSRFKWIRPSLFKQSLAEHLAQDTQSLSELLQTQGQWDPAHDQKLLALRKLITQTHGKDKVLVFTQFADTARYLAKEIRQAGATHVEVATGASADPYALACRFSPKSNNKTATKAEEVRVLICTDVLSEGQNLQDSNVVVNFDLPWAIIRLIQRAGRVDRIGRRAEEIFCYSFLPADGVEALIQLRARIRQRLNENAEVVGTDEEFFDDEQQEEANTLRNLYTEQSRVLDDNDDEVDLASYAWQIWKQATQDDPDLARTVESLPPVVYSAKAFQFDETRFPLLGADATKGGALVYVKSPEGNDHLAWVGANGKVVTESQFAVLRAAECAPGTPPKPRLENHHDLVANGLHLATAQDKAVGGGLGRPSSPRRRAYERLKPYASEQMKTLFRDEALERALDDMYQRPLLETTGDLLNRLMRSGVNEEELAGAVKSLREEGRLTYAKDDVTLREPRVVCSMGLIAE